MTGLIGAGNSTCSFHPPHFDRTGLEAAGRVLEALSAFHTLALEPSQEA